MSQANTVRLINACGSKAILVPEGASLASLKIKLRSGVLREVALGVAAESYTENPHCMGASVGRFANRIKGAAIEHSSKSYQLKANEGENILHGGGILNRKAWQLIRHTDNKASFTVFSADGEAGFPGNFKAVVHYHLDDDNQLSITYEAEVDQACPVSLTNHSYFNLDRQHNSIKQHQLWLAAREYLAVDDKGIPGSLKEVSDTGFDFRQPKPIGQDLLSDDDQVLVKGYDHSFVLDAERVKQGLPVARLLASDLQLAMDMYTDKPAVQLYSGNHLGEAFDREGKPYSDYSGVALETQFLPDSPNRPDFPQVSCWLEPGQQYRYQTRFHFYQP